VALTLTSPAAGRSAPGIAELLTLRPGMLRPAVEELLAAHGLSALAIDRDLLLIEEPLMERVFEVQQTILRFDDIGTGIGVGRLASVHLRIEPDPGSSGAEVLRLYSQVRAELIKVLGRPAWERAEGIAPPGEIVYALSDGSLVRYLQWEADGLTVRAGVPRRVDGKLYLEVAITAERLPRHEAFWGLQAF
jgi:DNA-binding PucR family transcriptional regulator